MYSTVYIDLGLDWGGQGDGGNSWPGGLREELHRIFYCWVSSTCSHLPNSMYAFASSIMSISLTILSNTRQMTSNGHSTHTNIQSGQSGKEQSSYEIFEKEKVW